MKVKCLAILIGMALMLAACSRASANGEGPDSASLTGTQWALVAMQGQPPLPGTAPSAEFTEREIIGSTGCNRYFGSYEITNGGMTISQVGATEQYCVDPDGAMEQEKAFLAALTSVTGYRMMANRLELLDAAGDVVLTFRTPA
jgi:heat shock protein HslJ